MCFKRTYRLIVELLFLLIIIFLFVWGIYKIVRSLQLYYCNPVSYVVVTGNRIYTTNDKINQLIIELNLLKKFTKKDINLIQKKIESFPWVKQVSIRKQIPDTLKIHLVEHVLLAFWNNLDIISVSGVFFGIPDSYRDKYIVESIPILYGSEDSKDAVLIGYYIFNSILKASNFQIKSIKLDLCNSWQIVLQNGICLKLGKKNIIERLSNFIKIYPIFLYKIDRCNKRIDYVDLRYDSGLAVRWIPNTIGSVLCNN